MKSKIVMLAGGLLGAAAIMAGVAFANRAPEPVDALSALSTEDATVDQATFEAQVQATDVGVVVVHVDEAGPAAKVGVARADIITKVDGKDVNTARALAAAVMAAKAGDSMILTVQRAGAEKTFNVTLADKNGHAYLGLSPGIGSSMEVRGHKGGGFGHGDFITGTFQLPTQVISVTAGSPADKAGLLSGDVISTVNGTAIDWHKNRLGVVIAAGKPGDNVTLVVVRNGETKTISATLGESPTKPGTGFLGITFGPAFPDGSRIARGDLRKRQPETKQGGGPGQGLAGQVTIGNVVAGGPADKAGLKQGDIVTAVDGVSLTNPRAVVAALANHKIGDVLKVTVTHSGTSQDINITIDDKDGKPYIGVGLGFGGRGNRNGGPGQPGKNGPKPSQPGNRTRGTFGAFGPGAPAEEPQNPATNG